MSAVFGEILKFGQENGPDIQLKVTGDEFYAIHETLDGFTVVRDGDRGCFCYATIVNGGIASSGIAATDPPPPGLARHLRESSIVRHKRFEARRMRMRSTQANRANAAEFTFGPSQGLLEGRRLSNGAVRGLTILVEFQDVRTTVTTSDLDEMLNGQNYTRNGNVCSAREYFRIVSTGKLDYSNEVVGPIRLSQNRSYYVTHLLVKEVLDLAVAGGVDLKRYDSRGVGIIDALNILYAGQTQYDGELWPHNFSIDLRYGNMSTNLYLLTSAGRNASDLSIGTFCHENGHLLCRFPDMYDYGDVDREGDGVKSAGIGSYCLMGSGNHLNSGLHPSPVCGYLRDLAGWCDNEIVLNSASQMQVKHGAYDSVWKFKGPKPNEYFVVENRSKLGLDLHLPSSGLAIYHCDILGSNEFQDSSSQKHYQCSLLQADGNTDLERNRNQGDGGDLYGGINGVAVSNTSNPASRWWNGADSGLILADISVPGQEMTFRIGNAGPSNSIHVENVAMLAIPDNNATGIRSKITVADSGLLKRLTVNVDITHTYIGDLIVELTSPGGVKVALHSRAGAGTDNLVQSYDSNAVAGLAAFIGEQVHGDWLLTVRDVAGQDVGKLNRWSIDAVMASGPTVVRGSAVANLAIPDNVPAGVSSSILLAQAGSVAKIKVSIDITHTYIGDLRIELVSPAGRAVVLHSQLGAGQDNLIVTYDSATPLSPLGGLVGQPIQGNWTLRVADKAAEDIGTLNQWSLEITPAA